MIDRSFLLLIRAELRAAGRAMELRFLLAASAAAGTAAAHPDWFSAHYASWTRAMNDGPATSDTPNCLPGEGSARRIGIALDSPLPPPDWFQWHEPLLPDPGPPPPAPEAPATEAPAPTNPSGEGPAPDALLHFRATPPADPGSAEALRPAALRIEIRGMHPKAELDAIETCAALLVGKERRRRLDALGIPEAPGELVRVEVAAKEAPLPDRAPEPFGLALVSFLALSAITWAYEALPGARQRGWLESLSAAPTSPRVVVGAYVAMCTLWALLNGLIFCLSGMLNGVQVDARWLLIPVISASVSALSVRTFLPMPDLRSSSLRTAWVPLAAMALGGLAILLESRWGLGGLVPFGGMILPWFGGGGLSVLLGVGSGLGVVWLCIRSGAALLARDALGQAADPTDARRAAGRYGPEALLLFLLALSGVSMAIAPAGSGPVFHLASGQIFFQLLPALLAPVLLGLPLAGLLGLRPPAPRAWVAAPVVLGGTLSAGLLAGAVQTALLPSNPFAILELAKGIEDLRAGWGLLFLTVGAGLCEELLFRGAILGLLLRAGSPTRAVIVQAVAFALLHVLAFKLFPTGAIGLILGLLAWRCGSVWPGILVHTAHNATLLLWGERWPRLVDVEAWGPLEHGLAGGIAGLGVAAAWWAGGGRKEG